MFEYNMSKEMAAELLKNRKGDDKKKDNQEYLVKVVNEQFGLRLPVTKVFTTLWLILLYRIGQFGITYSF